MKIALDCNEILQNKLKVILQKYLINYKIVSSEELDYLSVVIKEVKDLSDITYLKDLKSKTKCDIICLIKSCDYMFELLDLKPLGFIRSIKINEEINTLIKYLKYKSQGLNHRIEFKSNYQMIRINVNNIMYVESIAHYLLIHTQTSTFKVREKISSVSEKLKPFGFIQVHKSYIVNEVYITKIDKNEIELLSEKRIPVGKKYRKIEN